MTKVKEAQPDLLAEPMPKEMKSVRPAKKKSEVATISPSKPTRAVAVKATAAPKSMLAVIAEATANPACDVGKMEALLEMQEKLEDREARRTFVRAFIDLQEEMPSIRQDGRIEVLKKGADGQRVAGRDVVQQSTPYATFNNIMRVAKPILTKHGFGLSFRTEPSPGGDRIIVKGVLEHVDGHTETTAFPLPAETSGSKNNVQGWGSSMSFGKRYCTIALLNIVSHAPEDEDRNGATPKKASGKGGDVEIIDDGVDRITPKQVDELIDLVEACGAKRSDFCAAYGIDKVADLPAASFDAAVKACNTKMKKAGARG